MLVEPVVVAHPQPQVQERRGRLIDFPHTSPDKDDPFDALTLAPLAQGGYAPTRRET